MTTYTVSKESQENTHRTLSEAFNIPYSDINFEDYIAETYRSNYAPKLYGENNGMYGKRHTETSKQLMSKKKKDKIIVKDSNGATFSVYRYDPRFLSGELVGTNKNITFSTNKSYKLTSPTGDVYTGNFSYIKSIVSLHNISLSALYSTTKSKQPVKQGKTKGWFLEVFKII